MDIKLLSDEDTAYLVNVKDKELRDLVFEAAKKIKFKVYDNRIVTFAPLYLGSKCVNNCKYCGFRCSNNEIERRVLTMEEVRKETQVLCGKIGHKRLVVVYGEHPATSCDYIVESMKTIYSVKEKVRNGIGEIRRVNINSAPMCISDMKRLHEAGIGTFQVFQETYNHKVYKEVHPENTLKGNYRWRLYALHRAMEAGVDDVAIGTLFGLADWRFEVLGMVAHARDLEEKFGLGPHTVSVPRLEPAAGTEFDWVKHWVSDEDFRYLVAVLRVAIPYAGLIVTNREKPEMIKSLIDIITQRDADSRIGIGSYTLAYENGELVRVLTPEGYVEKSGSGYAHYYYIRDYQGNVRVVADATGAVKEENGYYPFGMLHGGDGGIQPYKYNGKELDRMHGLEWYDYGARMYNGYRFTTPDRYAEKYPSLSPYQYGANNPVNVIDINGDSLKIMSSEAIEAIYHGLEDKNVTMEWQDGVLDPNSIKAQAANSNDFFLKDLYEIASSEEMVELIFSYENVYCRNGYLEIEDWEKPTDGYDEMSPGIKQYYIDNNIPLGFHINGNLGQSLFPIFSPLSGKRSLNNNIQVIINSKGSLNHRTVGLAHEFGHVILYLNNRPYGHTQPGVDEFVGVRSTTMSKRLGYDW